MTIERIIAASIYPSGAFPVALIHALVVTDSDHRDYALCRGEKRRHRMKGRRWSQQDDDSVTCAPCVRIILRLEG